MFDLIAKDQFDRLPEEIWEAHRRVTAALEEG